MTSASNKVQTSEATQTKAKISTMAAPLPNTRRTVLTTPEATSIYHQIESELPNAVKVLEEATQLASKAGFSLASDLLVVSSSHNNAVAVSTGGHSNTDHVVVQSGDFVTDRISELKRNLLRRRKECQPESKGEDRWVRERSEDRCSFRLATMADDSLKLLLLIIIRTRARFQDSDEGGFGETRIEQKLHLSLLRLVTSSLLVK